MKIGHCHHPPPSHPARLHPGASGADPEVLSLKELRNCFLKRRREKKKSGLVVVDDAYQPPKPCGLQAQRFALPADQYPGPALG